MNLDYNGGRLSYSDTGGPDYANDPRNTDSSQDTGDPQNTGNPQDTGNPRDTGGPGYTANTPAARRGTILFLHGWGSDSGAFRGIISRLEGTGYRLVALDFPGCGGSSLPEKPLTVRDYADAVLAVLNHLNIRDPVIIAHSHGARVALYMAGTGLLNPPKMILFGAAGLRTKSSPAKRLKVLAYKTARRFLTLPPLKKHTAGTLERLRSRFGSADYAAAPPVLRQTLNGLVNSDIGDVLPAVKASTLLIWGENDTATPLYMARRMEKTIPDCGLCVIPGAGHWVFAERPGAVYPIIDNFLGITG